MCNVNYDFILEPICTHSGAVMAYELLTRWQDPNRERKTLSSSSAEYDFFKFVPEKDIDIFHEQIDALTRLYATGFPLTVTVNVDKNLVENLLQDNILQKRLIQLPKVRLELSGFFSSRLSSEDILTLKCLSRITPLWLDDFGAGFTNMTLASTGLFEIIKIDKKFFWRHGSSMTFDRVLSHLYELCKGIIVEGIETEQHVAVLQSMRICGMQGHRWQTVLLSTLLTEYTNFSFPEQHEMGSKERKGSKKTAVIRAAPLQEATFCSLVYSSHFYLVSGWKINKAQRDFIMPFFEIDKEKR